MTASQLQVLVFVTGNVSPVLARSVWPVNSLLHLLKVLSLHLTQQKELPPPRMVGIKGTVKEAVCTHSSQQKRGTDMGCCAVDGE